MSEHPGKLIPVTFHHRRSPVFAGHAGHERDLYSTFLGCCEKEGRILCCIKTVQRFIHQSTHMGLMIKLMELNVPDSSDPDWLEQKSV